MQHTATERWTVPARRPAVATARGWTTRFLTGLGVPEDLVTTTELLVSELVTNAVRHAETEAVTITVALDPQWVRVAVRDDDPLPPSLVVSRPDDVGGRGLGMVARAGADWGVTDHGPAGKSVWFALPRGGA